ncbi:MAG: hypothetical protein LUQ35_04380 [Methanoregula sp.]|jgi:hypothetical protein|nr:hypothetical protein [Methanoregula sp.]
MRTTTLELIKKIEKDTEIPLSATEALTCRIAYARVPQIPADGTQYLHHGIQFVTGLNEDGNVLILCDPFASDTYSVKPPGADGDINEFMKNALTRIPAERNAAAKEQEEGCGTSCG